MTLRAKTLVVIAITLLGLLALLYLAANSILLAGFERLEAQAMRQNVRRAQDALADDLERLNTTAADYAAWDDTYAFAGGKYPEYAEINLTEPTFINLNLNVLLIVNAGGEVVYGSGFDQATGRRLPLPSGLNAYLTPGSRLLAHTAETASLTGLLATDAGALLVVSRPILTSDYTGPIRGALIMGRYLDAAEVDRLAQITHLSLLIEPANDPATPPDLRAAQAGLSDAASISVQPLNAQTVAGYTALTDLDGQIILILRVDEPRVIYDEGRNSVTFFLLSLLLAGLVFGAAIWLLLERLVLARLARLSRDVQAIGAHSDAGAQVAVSGQDELSGVATAINGMLRAQAQATAATRASEDKFPELAETSAAAIFITQGARTRYANTRAEALTGYTHRDLLALPFQAVVPVALQSAQKQADPNAPAGDGRPGQFEIQIVSPGGHARWLDVTAGPIEFEGEPATIATAYDITERKHAEEGLQTVNEQLTTLVGQLERRNRESGLLSQMSDLLQACPTAEESYDVIATFFRQLLPARLAALFLYRPSRDKLEAVVWAGDLPAGANERMFAPDACWALRLGHAHSMSGPDSGLLCAHVGTAPAGGYLCVPIIARGDALGVLHVRPDALEPTSPETRAGLRAEWQRLTETVGERLALALANVNLREALRHQAVRDPLTGLFNRRYMQETLEREVSRAHRNNHNVAVLFLDLDHFKRFNDTHGHDAGDALLREVGLLLKSKLRAEDIACRYGGEEFLLIMPETTLASALKRAELLRAEAAALRVKHYDEMLGAVSLSVGVAVFPDHGATGDLVIRAADQALYRAKDEGRDQVAVAEPPPG